MNFYTKQVKLTKPVSNNKFSYEKRTIKEIYIPALKEGKLKEVKESTLPSFIEITEDGIEKSCLGLESLIKIKDKDIYIVDNHNHVFYFAYLKYLESGSFDFIHIDQHKDLREPTINFSEFKNTFKEIGVLESHLEDLDLTENLLEITKKPNYDKFLAYAYTNSVLNVGNFIKPLIEEGVIKNFYCVDSNFSMDNIQRQTIKNSYVLDIDLDFFSSEMDYIEFDKKIELIKSLMPEALAIYFCTSPFFVDFPRCIRVLELLLSE